MRIAGLLLTTLLCYQFANGLRILGVFPHNAKSHWMLSEKLMTSLAKRGHRVDVITHYPQKKPIPNYTDISLEGTLPPIQNNVNASNVRRFVPSMIGGVVEKTGRETCKLLGLPHMQQLIKNPPKDPPYDLVIVELLFMPCYLAFSRHLKIPVIGTVSAEIYDWLRDPLGNPSNPAYMPSVFSTFNQRMTFWERLSNTWLTHSMNIRVNFYSENQRKIVKEYFGIDEPIYDLNKDVAAVLLNTHHSLNGIKPMTQNLIEVGGLHISEDADALTPELQKWLDESTEGCILFTFGSMVRIETFPKSLLETFYKVFEKIAPVRVLMKIAKKEDLPPGLPKNVRTYPWLPQVSIFKHKNTKAFITHGGLLGTIEAVHFNIPMVGIPLFADQYVNTKIAANKKIAVSLGSIDDVTEETLTVAINTVLYNKTYRSNMKRMSEIFRDRPLSPIDTAIYWIEYVGKYGNILQSPAIHLNFWQRNLIDVYAFLLASVAIVLYIVIFILQKLKNRLFGCKSFSMKDDKSPELKKKK